MSDVRFVPLIETNDHEGERWIWWIKFDGNAEALELIESAIDRFDMSEEFDLRWDSVTSEDLELLEWTNQFFHGYCDQHNRVDGKLNLEKLTDALDGEWEDVSEVLYKGGIQSYVTKE